MQINHILKFASAHFAIVLLTVMLRFELVAQETNAHYDHYSLMQNLPQWSATILQQEAFSARYQISVHMNPFFYEEDFDGDQKKDLAVFIEEKKSSKKGILMLNGKTKQFEVLGAGSNFANGGDDFSWMDVWRPDRKFKILPNRKPPLPAGTSLWVEKTESASARIYWNGQEYHWFQDGD